MTQHLTQQDRLAALAALETDVAESIAHFMTETVVAAALKAHVDAIIEAHVDMRDQILLQTQAGILLDTFHKLFLASPVRTLTAVGGRAALFRNLVTESLDHLLESYDAAAPDDRTLPEIFH